VLPDPAFFVDLKQIPDRGWMCRIVMNFDHDFAHIAGPFEKRMQGLAYGRFWAARERISIRCAFLAVLMEKRRQRMH